MREQRPHILLKMAVSADAKVALAGRRPVAISGEAANSRVHLLRAQSDAILIGIGTAKADNPLLTCRLPGMADRSPVRVVLDARLELPVDGRLVETARATPVWAIAAPVFDRRKADILRAHGVEILSTDGDSIHLDIRNSLNVLSRRGITRVMVEGGPRIAKALLCDGLVDQIVLLRSPDPIGPDGIDAFEDMPLEAVTESKSFVLQEVEMIGRDRVETFERRA
jgi:diaminohydroxyphosphoribosylaminopyrimidine deaminase/5-amino-6-(5-phosphoribosylamino)uracil reductase